ncbi:MAG: protein kinase [Polyangiales bacterium]
MRPSSVERLASRVGAGLASPLGILLILPSLVSMVGSFLTLAGERALRESNLAVARDRMLEQATLVATSVRDALDQAEPMLDRLSDLTLTHDANAPYAGYAHALLDLMEGRHGVTYVSVSFPDGTFQGAYLDADGLIRFQDSRIGAESTRVLRYDYGPRGQLVLEREDSSRYDPRIRQFYLSAVRERRRVWTEPYLFYDSRTAGISRAAPVYREVDGKRTLHAVVTIDFDVNGLSTYLRGRQLRGMRALLYVHDGTLLAYAGDDDGVQLASANDRPLRLSDVRDPLLRAFFAEAGGAPREAGPRYVKVRAAREPYLGAIAQVSADPSLPWSMAYIVPERQFLRELHTYEDRSLLIGSVAVLLSTLVAFLFARHITRVRTEAAEAKAEAREARAEAREARAEARELGSYRLVACLGRGGMGEVWRAQHRLLAREAAVKLIKSDGGGVSQSLHQRFRREAEALARLRSRNTIDLFDYGVAEDGTFFLVMELLDGLDLDTLVVRHGPQPPERVVHLMLQACSSLAEAHDQGLVHRDIKPANLFVCRAADEVDLIKVLDFGLVRGAVELGDASRTRSVDPAQAGRLTQAEGVIGTPAFVAPEQAQGRALDGRADLYALGGVAYWLLTGRLLFERDSAIEQLIAHIHDPLPPLDEVLPANTPPALAQVVAACLAKLPSDRPASARELSAMLRGVSFPLGQAWTDTRAQIWWATHRARASEPAPEPEPIELAVGPTLTITKV